MYTQCPECETYFRVTEDDLAAAEGQVRCSQCEAVFDAGARLLTPAQERALGPDATAPVGGDDPVGPDAVEDGPSTPDAAADAATDPVSADAADDADGAMRADGASDPAIGDLFGPADADPLAAAPAGERDPALDLAALETIDAPRPDPSLDSAPLGFELPTGASPLLAAAGRPRPKRGPWLAACAVLLLALGAQSIHASRESLARDPRFGPTLVDAYRALDLPMKQPTDLKRLAVARTDVTSHPVYRDVLYITATVTNEAEFVQPLPLLRVRLDDRWGEPVGVRIFRPEEYLRRAEPSARAEPGRAYAIALEVVDPGSEAVGYALTPCLPQGETLVCLGDG